MKFRTEMIKIDKAGNGVLEDTLYLKITLVDDKLKDLSKPAIYELDYTEEEYHKSLRKRTSELDKLITSHSTNPEWNPKGYSNNYEIK